MKTPTPPTLKSLAFAIMLMATFNGQTAYAQSETETKESGTTDEQVSTDGRWLHAFIAAGLTRQVGGEYVEEAAFSPGIGVELHRHLPNGGLVLGLELLTKGDEHDQYAYLDPFVGFKLGEIGFYGGAAIEFAIAFFETDPTWGHEEFQRVNVGPRAYLGYAFQIRERFALTIGMNGTIHVLPDNKRTETRYLNLMFNIGIAATKVGK